ncbi:short-chain dehydrogenase [Massilia sp. Root351]|jgi:NAD(P)-dependent dehydrogenase (short-subunit alcohol dehydrogenase family)|uniref:SDR family oxidoreductase n=1 Tax=Massilia sp. Root351 TaxID=1736522 RepID=UPI00070E1600|nr:SDR family oxidoreductase [Massilia sp. Root351]KQV90582.1 short-chain dehydrogenase [Massilia sp. Root351]
MTTIQLLAGRKVLVTGAARGLGLAFATAIAEAGATVALADILHDTLAASVAALRERGLQVHGFPLDMADPASIDACAAAAVARLGGLDGLVNNAAITNSGGRSSEQIEIAMWDKVMEVNVRGTWLMTNACLPALRASGSGAIVNLASDTPLWGAPNLMAYVASKGAIMGMTRSLAREEGAHNITVNAVAPGLTKVEATEYVPAQRYQTYQDGRALQRLQVPEDVTGAVLFALSGLSRFVTGQVLAVNGGFVMN